MRINKEYIENIRFDTVKKRYYDGSQVDGILDIISDAVDSMNDELDELTDQITKYQVKENELSEAVLTAQRLSAIQIGAAEQKAAQILSEARAEKAQIEEEIKNLRQYKRKYINALMTDIKTLSEKEYDSADGE